MILCKRRNYDDRKQISAYWGRGKENWLQRVRRELFGVLELFCILIEEMVTRPHRRQPTRLPRPWDSPGKNTGVSCHLESSNTEGSGDKIVENAHKPFQWLQTFQPIGNRELLKNWQQERCHVLEILSSRKTSWRAVEEEWNLWLDLWELLIQSW